MSAPRADSGNRIVMVELVRPRASSTKRRETAVFGSALMLIIAGSIFMVSNQGATPSSTSELAASYGLLAEEKPAAADLCASGLHQSPIDLPQAGAKLDILPYFGWADDASKSAALESLENDAFQVQDLGNPAIQLDPTPEWFQGLQFKLQDLRFVTPSEHTVDGKHFDMEMQMLHTAVIDGQQRHMVVSQFFIEHPRAIQEPSFIAKLMDQAVPKITKTPTSLVNIDFQSDIVKTVLHGVPHTKNYMQYQGSLSTPPCMQGTTWVVLKTPLQMSAGDLAAIKAKQGANNRATQPLNGRTVYDAKPDVRIPLPSA